MKPVVDENGVHPHARHYHQQNQRNSFEISVFIQNFHSVLYFDSIKLHMGVNGWRDRGKVKREKIRYGQNLLEMGPSEIRIAVEGLHQLQNALMETQVTGEMEL